MEAVGLALPAGTAARGGLTVAVGGIEVTLLDLTNAFATLARGGTVRQPRLLADAVADASTDDDDDDGAAVLSPLTAAAITDMLSSRHRVPHAGDGAVASAAHWFAWKTGTSSARRDAVAVGHNGRYAIGVWVGRFAGGGDVAYTGRTSAEPLLTRMFAGDPVAVASVAAPMSPDAEVLAARVRRPLRVSQIAADDATDAVDRASVIRIQAPRDGDRFLAWAGPVGIEPVARRVDPATGIARAAAAAGTWLLNGRPLEADHGTGQLALQLDPGRYELTFVGDGRLTDTVRFTVRATDAR